MTIDKKVIAFDFGASSGRAVIGTFDGESIKMQELHRFSNDPVFVQGTMYWDILRLLYEIKQSLLKAKFVGKITSIGIDTWGVDFGLLDEDGNLLDNPVHYRDTRTAGMLAKSFTKIAREEFYAITGNQFMEINTVFQLMALLEQRPRMVKEAKTLLLMPDLLNYLLSGEKKTEYSIASTTQILDAASGEWSERVIAALSLPHQLFTPIVPSGTRVGWLTETICEELGIDSLEVIAVAGHDTQSALAAVPAQERDFIFLSCGTWSLLGTELDRPLINEKSAAYNLTNEGGYGGKISFLKNIIGLWLIQESRRQWIREGKEYSFGQLEELAKATKPLQCFIDPDAPEFVQSGDIPARIKAYCLRTGQAVPESVGEIVRCIDESLALKYRFSLEQLVECTGKSYQTIYMVGGGTQSRLLCQLTANACGMKVAAGPIEATVLGNIALQLLATGAIDSLEKARLIIRNSQEIIDFSPEDTDLWESAYAKFKELIGC